MNKLRRLAIAACGMLMVSCGTTSGSTQATAQGVTSTTISLGAYGPLTGDGGYIGAAFRDGFEWGLDEINKAGGVNGRLVKVTFYDDQLSAANALVDVRRLAQDDQVFAIIAASGSAATVGVLAFVEQNGIPFYNGVAATPKVLHPFAHNVFDGEVMPTDINGAAIAAEIQHDGFKRPAIFYENGAYGTSGADATEASLQSLGIPVVSKQSYVFGSTTDWTPHITSAIANHADVIVLWGYEPDSAQIPKQARALGYTGAFEGDIGSCDPSVVKGGAAVEGQTCSHELPAVPGEPGQPAMSAWLTKFNARFPSAGLSGQPNLYDLEGYAEAYNFAHALQLAGKTPTWNSFISALESIKGYQGTPVSAPVGWSATDHQGNHYVSFHVIKNGTLYKRPFVFLNGQIVPQP